MPERRYRIDNSLNVLLEGAEKCDTSDPEQAAFHEAVQAMGEADLRRDNPGYHQGTALELFLRRLSPPMLSWLERIKQQK